MKTKQQKFRTILHAAVVLAAGIAPSSFASAGYSDVTTAQRLACTPDVFRLCSSEIPNVDNIVACMMAKKASLSQSCRSVIDAAMSKKTASRE